jgi:hypothetical protein
LESFYFGTLPDAYLELLGQGQHNAALDLLIPQRLGTGFPEARLNGISTTVYILRDFVPWVA